MTPPQFPLVLAARSRGLGVYVGMVQVGFLNWELQEPIGSSPGLSQTPKKRKPRERNLLSFSFSGLPNSSLLQH